MRKLASVVVLTATLLAIPATAVQREQRGRDREGVSRAPFVLRVVKRVVRVLSDIPIPPTPAPPPAPKP